MSRHNRPCLLCKVTWRVKVKPAIFGLGAHAHGGSPAVSGLEKPPAGSGEGEEEEEMVPVGRRLLIQAGASAFHTGECGTHRAAGLPGCSSHGPAGRSAPMWQGEALPSKTIHALPVPLFPPEFGLYLKLMWSSGKMAREKGVAKHTTHTSSQQKDLSF